VRKLLFGMLGLLFWLGTQWIALGIAAGGYGWIEPLWLSMLLIFLYPIAFIRAFCVTAGPARLDQHLLFLAAVLDALMVGSIFLHEEILRKAVRIIPENLYWLALWIALWAGWQLLLLVALKKHPQTDSWPS
jgi:hypothetical protein